MSGAHLPHAGDDDRDAEKQGEEEDDGAFDVSNIKGKLGKRTGAGPKRGGKKGAGEGADKKKADTKKPKQKVRRLPRLLQRFRCSVPEGARAAACMWPEHLCRKRLTLELFRLHKALGIACKGGT